MFGNHFYCWSFHNRYLDMMVSHDISIFIYCILQDDVKNETEHINLKVTGQDGSVVHFKIKRNTPLRKLMSAYCDRAVRTFLIWHPTLLLERKSVRISFLVSAVYLFTYKSCLSFKLNL